jgi:xanthine dehydrogenase small subunit
MPILIALGASLVLRQRNTVRQIPLEDFYIGYKEKNMLVGEFVEAVKIPFRDKKSLVASYKVANGMSKTFQQYVWEFN